MKLAALMLAFSGAVPALAGAVWDEAIQGDLANSGLTPTPLSVALGSNTVLGDMGNSGQGIDRDYFRFTVPTGAALTAISLLGRTAVSGGASFLAMQAGPQMTVSPTGEGIENLIGFTLYTNNQIGENILPGLLFGGRETLASGEYAVWVQDTGGPARYGFDFVISAAIVPEPGVAALMVTGLILLTGLQGVRRRR